MTIRIAQLGRGRWGKTLLRALADVPEAEVVAVFDPRDGGTEASFWEADADAIVVASPPASHGAQARRGLLAGRHVFVEKPLTMGDGQALLRLAEAQQRLLMVGHLLLYDDAAVRVDQWLRDGRLGRIQHVRFRRWGRRGAARDVDALWNLGPHDLALADRWFGDLSVTRSCAWSTDGVVCDEAWLELRAGGVPIEIHVGHGMAPPPRGAQRRAVIEGTAGTAVLEGERVSLHRGGAAVEAHVRRTDPLRAELTDFVSCIREGRQPRADAASGARVVRLLSEATGARRLLVRAG